MYILRMLLQNKWHIPVLYGEKDYNKGQKLNPKTKDWTCGVLNFP